MDESNNGVKRILNISSDQRTSGSPANFTVDIRGSNGLKPKAISVLSCELVNGFYNVNSSSNQFSVTLQNAGTSYTVVTSVTAGNYSVSNFPGVVQAALNAAITSQIAGAPANFLTVTVSNVTSFTTITSSSSGWTFQVNIIGSGEHILGYRQPSSLSTTVTGSVSIDLRSYPVIYIRSNLGSNNQIDSDGRTSNVILKMQNSAQFGQTSYFRASHPELDKASYDNSLSSLVFWLADENGYPLFMDLGLDWSISLILWD